MFCVIFRISRRGSQFFEQIYCCFLLIFSLRSGALSKLFGNTSILHGLWGSILSNHLLLTSRDDSYLFSDKSQEIFYIFSTYTVYITYRIFRVMWSFSRNKRRLYLRRWYGKDKNKILYSKMQLNFSHFVPPRLIDSLCMAHILSIKF